MANTGPTAQLYQEGEQVEYFSASISQWIPATILKFNSESNLYMLDCKPDVPPERIRHLPCPTSSPPPVSVSHGTNQQKFPIGAKVQYYSASIQQWIPATITSYEVNEKLYYLDVKPQVPEDRIRWPSQSTSPRPERPSSMAVTDASSFVALANVGSRNWPEPEGRSQDENDRTLSPDMAKNSVNIVPRTAASENPPQARVSFNDQVSRSESSFQSQNSPVQVNQVNTNANKHWLKEKAALNKQLTDMDALVELQKSRLEIAERERDRCVEVESELAQAKMEIEKLKKETKIKLEESRSNSTLEINDLTNELDELRKEMQSMKNKYEHLKNENEEIKNDTKKASTEEIEKIKETMKKKIVDSLQKLEEEQIRHGYTKDENDSLRIAVQQKDKTIAALEYGLDEYKREQAPVLSQVTAMREGRMISAA